MNGPMVLPTPHFPWPTWASEDALPVVDVSNPFPPPPDFPPAFPQSACRGCFEPRDGDDTLLQLPCGCLYCTECVERQFTIAMKDESLYPPRCLHHRHISLHSARQYLPPALVCLYKSKTLEMSTKDKTYCFRISCNSFVAPHSIHNGQAFCQKCNGKTCVVCKEEAHFGMCAENKGLMRLMELGKAKKWQQCPDCRKLIEKNDGCNHINCRCGCDFCYKCGHHLLSCSCEAGAEEDDDDDDDDDEGDEEGVDDNRATLQPVFAAYRAQQHDRPRTPVFRESDDEIISDTMGLRTDVDFEETGDGMYRVSSRSMRRSWRDETGGGLLD